MSDDRKANFRNLVRTPGWPFLQERLREMARDEISNAASQDEILHAAHYARAVEALLAEVERRSRDVVEPMRVI